MAIVYGGATANQGLIRAGLLASGTSATIMGWAMPTTLPTAGNYNNLFAETAQLGISLWNSGGAKWNLGTATTDNPGSTATVNVWAHLALTTSGATTHTMYLNGVSDATSVGSGSGTSVMLGNYDTAGTATAWNGRLAAVKIWDALLTADEIKQEMWSYRPVRTANLKAFYPLILNSDLGDYSGNSQTLTTNGTAPTTADGPPIGWGPTAAISIVPAGGGVTVDLSGSPNAMALTTVDPTVVLGSLTLDLTASPNAVALTTVDPTVILGSLSLNLTASPNALALTTVDPTVVLGSLTLDLSASPNVLTLTTVDPTVSAGGDVTVDLSASPNAMALTTADPTVVLGSLTLDLAATPATLVLTTVDPTVSVGSAVETYGDATIEVIVRAATAIEVVARPATTSEVIARPVTLVELVARPLTSIELTTRALVASELVTRRTA